jgi:hypothetical protein
MADESVVVLARAAGDRRGRECCCGAVEAVAGTKQPVRTTEHSGEHDGEAAWLADGRSRLELLPAHPLTEAGELLSRHPRELRDPRKLVGSGALMSHR